MIQIVNSEKKTIINWIVAYIIITFLLSVIGPVTFIKYHPMRVFLYLLYLIFAIYMGCLVSHRIRIVTYRSTSEATAATTQQISDFSLYSVKTINYLVYFSAGLYTLLFFDLLTSRGLSISTLLSSFSSLGNIYRGYLHDEFASNNFLIKLSTLFAIFPYCAMCGGIFVFKHKQFDRKIYIYFAVISIAEELLRNGQLAYVISWVLSIATYFLIKIVCKEKSRKAVMDKRRRWSRIIAFVLVFLLFFGMIQDSRSDTYNYNLKNFSTDYFYYNGNHIVYRMFPEFLGNTIAAFCYYLSGGYYGLDRNFDTSFYWTRGYGNSKALSDYLNQYLGIQGMYDYTYPLRTEGETGYPSGQYWSTVIPWLAGDFTFIGVGILFFLITILYLKCYKELRCQHRLISGILFMRLTQFFLFVPANNYIVQTRANLLITVFLFFAYFLSCFKMRYRIALRWQ